jgi:hypothetical protein
VKTRFDSQFSRRNCQISSVALSSGERAGIGNCDVGRRGELVGHVPASVVEQDDGVGAQGHSLGDLGQVKSHHPGGGVTT